MTPGLFPTLYDALERLPTWLCAGAAGWSAAAAVVMVVLARWPEAVFYTVAAVLFTWAARAEL